MGLESTEPGIGLELVQYEAAKILLENINAELSVVEAKWEDRDWNWAELTGSGLPSNISLEHVDPENVFPGHRPSLVTNWPRERYPNISVMAYSGGDKPGAQVDQASNFRVFVDIETMVEGESEYVVDKRNHRTVEAVHRVLSQHESLNKTSLGFNGDPSVNLTDVIERKTEGSHGENWWWAAARMRYSITRHNRLPNF